MNFLQLVEAKRDGRELSSLQIEHIVAEYTASQIPDYQMAAFLMAVCFRGLNAAETRALTVAMRDSGKVLTFPRDSRPLVDKHSTGGVGDKVSLVLAPLLACLGFRVPMISGRGLGITGGTLDKLDSIPGFQTALATEQLVEIVQTVGCVICGQTEHMVPADKKLYALRDATGTVPSIPLIVASILSKKLAEGLAALVLDVKYGTAAFMPTRRRAAELAQAMVKLGNACGVKTRALLNNMDTPLGRAAGNWLEVKEAVSCLESGTTATNQQDCPDLANLVIECAAQLLVQTGITRALARARQQARACLLSGAPRRKWDEMLAAQGADLAAVNRKLALDSTAAAVLEIKTQRRGQVTQCNARIIGEVVRDLGGGRATQNSVLNYDVGVDHMVKPGEKVKAGAVLARVHAADNEQAAAVVKRVRSAFALRPAG